MPQLLPVHNRDALPVSTWISRQTAPLLLLLGQRLGHASHRKLSRKSLGEELAKKKPCVTKSEEWARKEKQMQKSRGHKGWGVRTDPNRMDRPPLTLTRVWGEGGILSWGFPVMQSTPAKSKSLEASNRTAHSKHLRDLKKQALFSDKVRDFGSPPGHGRVSCPRTFNVLR